MAENKNFKEGSYLDQLTKGLYDAVVSAQSLAENQHIESLSQYFNKDGTPKCMEMVVNGEKINVPLATLASQSSIRIKELTIDLKVKLTNFGQREGLLGKLAGAIKADLGASIMPRKQYANLSITFEGSDPPEGLVRLNNNLIKQIP